MHPSMTKQPRITQAGELEANRDKPEKCTPSPYDYTFDKINFLPNLGRGGAGSLQA